MKWLLVIAVVLSCVECDASTAAQRRVRRAARKHANATATLAHYGAGYQVTSFGGFRSIQTFSVVPMGVSR